MVQGIEFIVVKTLNKKKIFTLFNNNKTPNVQPDLHLNYLGKHTL